MTRHHHPQHPGTKRPGKTLAMFLLLTPALLGMVGLTIDGGLLLVTYRQTQNAADAAALAAAVDLKNGNSRHRPEHGDQPTSRPTTTWPARPPRDVNIPPPLRPPPATTSTPRPSSPTRSRPRSSRCWASTRASRSRLARSPALKADRCFWWNESSCLRRTLPCSASRGAS